MTTWDELPLAEHHAKMLDASGLTPEVAAARGYRSYDAEHAPELNHLAPTPFGRRSCHAGLLVPTHGVGGGVVGHQLRPDAEVIHPRTGDIMKYLTPYGESAVIDCPPLMAPWLRDVSVPLLITEGSKKADAAAARGLLCLALRGVDSWTSAQGTALEDWRDVQLLGRTVGICYDSDFATNVNVRGAARRLAKYLTRRGALVWFVLLPALPDGGKRGLDDWLADHPDADPWALAVEQLPVLAVEADPDRTPVLATDLNLADVWVERNAPVFRYVTQTEKWLGFDGVRWDDAGGRTLARAAYADMIRTLAPYSEKIRDGEVARVDQTPWMRAAERMNATLRLAAANRETHVSMRQLDEQPYLFNLANGTYDLDADELLTHDAGDLLSLASPVAYDPDAASPHFDAFLARVLPDEDTRAFVQRVFGMAMIGDATAKQHVFPVFQGTGRNGKGTLMRLVQAVFGSYYAGISKSLLVVRNREEHSAILAALFHKRLVTAQEVGERDTWDAAMIKELTGGDDITARFMRENNFTFSPSHTLVMAANNWPKVSAKDEAFWRRVRKVPFTTVFERDDPRAEKVLMAELPGVLNWLLAGCRDFRANGLGEPAQVAAATAASRADSDPLQAFLSEYVEVTHDPYDTVAFAELYDRLYLSWHRTSRQTGSPIARNTFGAEVAESLGVAPPKRTGRDSSRSFIGLRLLDGGTQGDDPWSPPRVSIDVNIDRDRDADDADPGGAEGAVPPEADAEGPAASSASSLASPLKITKNTLGPAVTSSASSASSLFPPILSSLISSGNPGGVVDRVTSKNSKPAVSAESKQGAESSDARDARDAGVAEASSAITESEISYERLAPDDFDATATERLPDGVVVFDIESAAAEQLFTGGPEFVKIMGWQMAGDLAVTEDVDRMVRLLRQARVIVGHNIMSFDLLPFAIHHGFDIHQAAADGRLLDTQLCEVLLNPPPFWMAPARVPSNYKLDKLGQDKFGVGKSGDLAALIKRHGGNPKTDFHVIPNDDADYVRYCAADVDLTARLALTQRRTPAQADYMRREHRIAAIAAQITMNGVKVDTELLGERYLAGQQRKTQLRERLMADYGMPRTTKSGDPAKGLTAAGREAIERAFDDLGVVLPRSASGKGPATGAEVMREIAEAHADRPEIVELCETVQGFNGVRTVYGSALEALHTDGRVHPTINMYQATGRWSVSNPGMTVYGKRGGRHVEREIFIADEGEVMISADLSQVDARAIAAWSQDPEYLGMFAPGMDLHAEVAFQMFGDRGRREDAKAVSHGYNYGMQYDSLAERFGPDIARAFIDAMIQRFPRLEAWKDEIRSESKANDYVLDNGWGRRLAITPDKNFTQAPSYVGQSAARDIMMEGLLRLPRWVLPMLRVQVHDEIVLSVPEDRVDEVRGVLQDALSFPWRPFNGARGHTVSVDIIGEAGPTARSWGGVYAK